MKQAWAAQLADEILGMREDSVGGARKPSVTGDGDALRQEATTASTMHILEQDRQLSSLRAARMNVRATEKLRIKDPTARRPTQADVRATERKLVKEVKLLHGPAVFTEALDKAVNREFSTAVQAKALIDGAPRAAEDKKFADAMEDKLLEYLEEIIDPELYLNLTRRLPGKSGWEVYFAIFSSLNKLSYGEEDALKAEVLKLATQLAGDDIAAIKKMVGDLTSARANLASARVQLDPERQYHTLVSALNANPAFLMRIHGIWAAQGGQQDETIDAMLDEIESWAELRRLQLGTTTPASTPGQQRLRHTKPGAAPEKPGGKPPQQKKPWVGADREKETPEEMILRLKQEHPGISPHPYGACHKKWYTGTCNTRNCKFSHAEVAPEVGGKKKTYATVARAPHELEKLIQELQEVADAERGKPPLTLALATTRAQLLRDAQAARPSWEAKAKGTRKKRHLAPNRLQHLRNKVVAERARASTPVGPTVGAYMDSASDEDHIGKYDERYATNVRVIAPVRVETLAGTKNITKRGDLINGQVTMAGALMGGSGPSICSLPKRHAEGYTVVSNQRATVMLHDSMPTIVAVPEKDGMVRLPTGTAGSTVAVLEAEINRTKSEQAIQENTKAALNSHYLEGCTPTCNNPQCKGCPGQHKHAPARRNQNRIQGADKGAVLGFDYQGPFEPDNNGNTMALTAKMAVTG